MSDLKNIVSLVEAGDDIKSTVSKSIDLIGGLTLNGGENVIIKPNICNAKNPDGMVITDFRILKAVIDLVRNKTDRITVVESDNISDTADNRLEQAGLLRLLNEWDVNFLNLSNDETEVHSIAGKKLLLPKTVLDADFFINLPKIKTEGHVSITLSIKNLFGVLARRKKSSLHRKLNEILPYLAMTIRNDLIVVDGIVAMEGNGPLIGTPKPMGVILAGRNLLAVDATISRLMGIDPFMVNYLVKTQELGVGSMDESDIDVVGEDWHKYASEFERPYSLKATVKSIKSIRKIYI